MDAFCQRGERFPELESLTVSSDNLWYPSFALGHLDERRFEEGQQRGELGLLLGEKLKHLRVDDVHALAISDLAHLAMHCRSGGLFPCLETVEIYGGGLVHSDRVDPERDERSRQRNERRGRRQGRVVLTAGPVLRAESRRSKRAEDRAAAQSFQWAMDRQYQDPHGVVWDMFGRVGVRYSAHDLDPQAYWSDGFRNAMDLLWWGYEGKKCGNKNGK